MRWTYANLAVLGLFLLLESSGAGYGRPNSPQENAHAQKPIVIVELFTSEGCSSCPPAEEFVKRISEDQPIAGVEVVALEQHVDYWNHQGWTDPYSSPEFTQRQNAYTYVLPKGGVYTPQIIVDGSTEISGNRRKQASEAIQRAASLPKAHVTLNQLEEKGPGKVTYGVKIDHLPPVPKGDEFELWVAVTERGLQSDVKAGENSGETLRHAAVVRFLRKAATARNTSDFADQVNVKLDKNWKRENLIVVAFLVDKNSRKIVGGGIAPVA